MSLALDIIDQMIRDAVVTSTAILDAEEPHAMLSQRPELRRSLELGIGIRLTVLQEVKAAIQKAEIKRLEEEGMGTKGELRM